MAHRSDSPPIDPASRLRVGSSDPAQAEVEVLPPETIPDEHRASVTRGLADLRDGRIATEIEVEAVYRRFGR